jgi:hypothetical protein
MFEYNKFHCPETNDLNLLKNCDPTTKSSFLKLFCPVSLVENRLRTSQITNDHNHLTITYLSKFHNG